MLYFILRYILRYRQKVVRQNLRNAFPHKTESELRQIENGFYHHLSRLIRQILITPFLSQKAIKQRFQLTNVEVLDSLASQQRIISQVFGHFANWEWAICIPLYTNKVYGTTLYKQLSNKWLDNIMLRTRSQYGVECIEHKSSIRRIMQLQKSEKSPVFTFIADQTPTRPSAHHWITFLNQPTPIITGWAELAQRYNWALLYLDIKYIKHGQYQVTYEVLAENCNQYSAKQLGAMFMHRLEQSINQNPELWMWSHRRWKLQYNGETLNVDEK